MNTVRKVILSIWFPILIIFPVAMIDLKTDVQVSGNTKMWTSLYLYQIPWFWYFCAIATGIFLLLFWKPKPLDKLNQKEN